MRVFLAYQVVQGEVAASTRNPALNALLFPCWKVSRIDLPCLNDVERPRRPKELPVVLTRRRPGAQRLAAIVPPTYALMGWLLYGSGLKLAECVRLWVKDIDLAYRQLTVSVISKRIIEAAERTPRDVCTCLATILGICRTMPTAASI